MTGGAARRQYVSVCRRECDLSWLYYYCHALMGQGDGKSGSDTQEEADRGVFPSYQLS